MVKVLADTAKARFVAPPYLVTKTSHHPLHRVEERACGHVSQALMASAMDLLRLSGICRSWKARGKVHGLLTGCMQHDVEVEGEEKETVRQLLADLVTEHGNADADSEKEHESIDAASEREPESIDTAVQVELKKAFVSHKDSEKELESIGVAVQAEQERAFARHKDSEKEHKNSDVVA